MGGDFARHGFLPSLSTTEQLWRARYSVIIRIVGNINIDKKVLNDLIMNVICGVVEYFVGLSDDAKTKKMTIIINGHFFQDEICCFVHFLSSYFLLLHH